MPRKNVKKIQYCEKHVSKSFKAKYQQTLNYSIIRCPTEIKTYGSHSGINVTFTNAALDLLSIK